MLERGPTTLVFKAVPARVCDTCGETYLDQAVTTTLLQIVDVAAATGVQVEVRQYAAA